MIRQMVRRKLVAVVAVVATVSTGMPGVFAASSDERSELKPYSATPTWSLQLVDGNGNAINVVKATPQAGSQRPSPVPLPGDIGQLRQELQNRQKGAYPRLATMATQQLRWLDVIEAKTAAARHEKIQQFGVTVTTSSATDGRAGTVKSFVAGGKTRVRLFVPAFSASPAGAASELGGPSDAEVVQDLCYNDEPGPCATEQEMWDTLMAIAEAQSETDSNQGAFDSDYASYCWDTGDCHDPDPSMVTSGPSACERGGCLGYAGAAVWALGTATWGIAVAAADTGTAFTTVALSSGAAAGVVASVAGMAFAGGYAVGSFIACHAYRMY